MHPIRILYVNNTSRMSGAEFSLLSLMRNLDKRQFAPLLALPTDGPFQKKASEAGIEAIIVPSLNRGESGSGVSKIPKILMGAKDLIRLIPQKNVGLVHCNDPRTSYLGGLAARICRVPSVTHVRDIVTIPFRGRARCCLLRVLADRIVSVSVATKEAIINGCPSLRNKVIVIYNGVAISPSERAGKPKKTELRWPNKDGPRLGCIGRVSYAKGQEVLVRAAELILKDFPSLRVDIVGPVFLESDRAYYEKLKTLIHLNGLSHSIHFLEFQEDVLKLIEEFDVIVHPAVEPDPLPRVLLEALAVAKPVVASSTGGIPEIIEHEVHGLLVKPGSPSDLANAVRRLLLNPRFAEELGRRGQERVRRCFSIEAHVQAMTRIYRDLLKQSHG